MKKDQTTRRNFLLKMGAVTSLLAVSSPLLLTRLSVAASGTSLTGASLASEGNALHVAFVLSDTTKYKVFKLSDPERVVIDLDRTTIKGSIKQGRYDRPPLAGIRYATRPDGGLRIVLDMLSNVAVSSSLKAKRGDHILTVSLQANGSSTSAARTPPLVATTPSTPTPSSSAPPQKGRFVVVLDAGHGGHDPGAIGRLGTREKDVVLGVARKLKSRIERDSNMKVVMTRDSDTFIPLRQRLDIARRNNADLFISIHADANNRSQVHGSSVYVLSQNGASSEAARLLAESENNAFGLKLGDLTLGDEHNKVAPILLDLSQNATLEKSLELAKRTLRELAAVNNPLRSQVESAGFMVLKAPDIPSMLVETAFLSNRLEEKRLRTDNYQQQLADAIFKGVRSYQQAFAETQERYA